MSRQNWRTDRKLFGKLTRRFGYVDFDVAADSDNALSPIFYTEAGGPPDAAKWPKDSRGFCNPPFEDPRPFVFECIRYRNYFGGEVIFLCKADVNASWFHLAMNEAQLWIPRGRITYWHPDEPNAYSPAWPSCVFYFPKLGEPTFTLNRL